MFQFLKNLLNLNKKSPDQPKLVIDSDPVIVENDAFYSQPEPVQTKNASFLYDRELLIEELLQEEGKLSYAYDDSTGEPPYTPGYITIGVGRMIDKRRGGGLSENEILYLLHNDINRTEKDLNTHLPWWRFLDPVRARVVMNMAFNMGIGNSKRGLRSFVNTLTHIEAGHYDKAAAGMLRSKWARQVKGRATRLAYMMEFGKVPETT